MHALVIGAGSAGVCAAKTLLQAGIEVTVYEKSNEIGGTWIFTDEVDKPETGFIVHSSMYKNLIINLPKEVLNFPDILLPEQDISYISSEDILNYIQFYAEHFNLENHIKFQHRVIRVTPFKESQWEVLVQDIKNKKIFTKIFDAVIICNGQFFAPNFPHITGIENFKGKVLHSHNFRRGIEFQDQNVLLIGGGPSGSDIAVVISKHANHVTLSHHLKDPLRSKSLPDNFSQKPDVKEIKENGVEFVDGTVESFDVICFCTGYRHVFPFLSVDCEITGEGNYVRPLYKHTININKPTMSIIGLPYPLLSFRLFDLQAKLIVKYLSGENVLPSKLEMLDDTQKDENERNQLGIKKRNWHHMTHREEEFYSELATTAKVSPIDPVILKIHKTALGRTDEDFIDSKNDRYRIIDDETFIRITNGTRFINS